MKTTFTYLDCHPEYDYVFDDFCIETLERKWLLPTIVIPVKEGFFKTNDGYFRFGGFLHHFYNYELHGNMKWWNWDGDDLSMQNCLSELRDYYPNYLTNGVKDKAYYRKVMGI